jgi:N-acylneuraminate cytidylyltransferase
MSRNICIIPARGGSKRIPRKNIKDFLGKPIIAYAIEMALKTNLFEEVMVSTDDSEIAEIAKSCGAKVPFLRSIETSDDFATTAAVIKEVIGTYRNMGKEFNSVCCLYPTAVLANSADISEGYELLGEADIVLPVTEFSFPPLRSFHLNERGLAEYRYPEHSNTRSQDLEPWYHDAGQWYWYQIKFFEKELEIYKCKVIKLPNTRVQDIDNMEDWALAKIKYSFINGDL